MFSSSTNMILKNFPRLNVTYMHGSVGKSWQPAAWPRQGLISCLNSPLAFYPSSYILFFFFLAYLKSKSEHHIQTNEVYKWLPLDTSKSRLQASSRLHKIICKRERPAIRIAYCTLHHITITSTKHLLVIIAESTGFELEALRVRASWLDRMEKLSNIWSHSKQSNPENLFLCPNNQLSYYAYLSAKHMS